MTGCGVRVLTWQVERPVSWHGTVQVVACCWSVPSGTSASFLNTPCLPGDTGVPWCYGTQYENNAIGHSPSRYKPVHMYCCLELAVNINDAVVAQYWAVPDMGYNIIVHVCLYRLAVVISQSCGWCIQTSFVRNSGFFSEVLLSVHRILGECIWNAGKMIVYTRWQST